ncbi:hypothetical protein OHV97_03500 [Streptomyces virginiae]
MFWEERIGGAVLAVRRMPTPEVQDLSDPSLGEGVGDEQVVLAIDPGCRGLAREGVPDCARDVLIDFVGIVCPEPDSGR